MTQSVYIVGMSRTPFGSFLGGLSRVSAPRLGAVAIKDALKKAQVDPEKVSEVILGNVLSAGIGQAPARQASIYGGIPKNVPCFTINKMCGSGMQAIFLARQSLLLDESEIVVCGGMENMSLAPYLVPQGRSGFRMGHSQIIDSMIHDGLWDPYHQEHMGHCGDLCAQELNISREEQDALSAESFRRAQRAQKEGKFKSMIAPVTVSGRKGDIVVSEDEGPSKVKFDKISHLKPVFSKEGTVTAANASTINDGAAVLVLASEKAVSKYGLRPLAKILSCANHAQDPQWFTTAPAPAMEKAMKKIQWKIDQVDLFEVNEAFAVVALATQKKLGFPLDKLNVWGGAISLGHPIGASGARITMTLVEALKDSGKKRGVAGICIGGGEATALCLETL